MNIEDKPISNLWKDSKGYRYFGTLKLSSKIKYDGDDFIPLWEWVEKLQQENEQQKEVINKAIELLNNFNFKILMDNRTMYIRLKDLEQGKDLLKLLKEVSE